MPYFLNCSRCNEDNKFKNLGNSCPKCSGTGRDWRDDHELEGFHKWAGITIDELKKKRIFEFIDDSGELKVFTYMDSIPTCSINEEIEEIRRSFGDETSADSKASQIFCKHDWEPKKDTKVIEICSKCGKERKIADVVNLEKVVLQYNKSLHDRRYYFPNRCYACDYYSNSRGEPETGSDMIYCNIGGEVRADTGCSDFKADVTAECRNCWNLITEFQGPATNYACDLKGSINSLVSGGCAEHVGKERTENEIPDEPDAILKNKVFLKKNEYPDDPKIRGPIIDAMIESGIRYVNHDEFSFDQRCTTCVYENNIMYDFGSCEYHGIGILCYSGNNPYGYDEKICEHYTRKQDIAPVRYPLIYIELNREGDRKLNENYHVKLRDIYCDVIETNSGRVIATFNHMDRAPNFMRFNEDKNCIDLFFYGDREELSLDPSISYEHSPKKKEWIDIDEDEMFKAIDRVSSEQRKHDVYSGSRSQNCERCNFVERNSAYPEGSPTGLICTKKRIFVTANGCCDNCD